MLLACAPYIYTISRRMVVVKAQILLVLDLTCTGTCTCTYAVSADIGMCGHVMYVVRNII
jgi:hypothetical protein